jgi:hypothetical protein
VGAILRLLLGAAGALPVAILAPPPAASQSAVEPVATAERATVTGVRITEGGAVDCPTIRDDAGAVHPVARLSPRTAVGDRVTVSGFYAVTTTCRGRVLVIEEERPPG